MDRIITIGNNIRSYKIFNRVRFVSTLRDMDLPRHKLNSILHKLNTASPAQLAQLQDMTPDLAENIFQYREIYGDISEDTSFTDIKGINDKIITSLYTELVNTEFKSQETDINQNKINYIPRTKVTPKFESKQLPDSVISYSIDLNTFSWIHMNSSLEVISWEQRPLLNKGRVAYNHVQWYNKLNDILLEIPLSQNMIYITEETSYQTPSVITIGSTIARARLDTMFSTIIAERIRSSLSQYEYSRNVYKIKPSLTAEHFELDVGGQRVSGRDAVRDIEHGRCPPARGVYIPTELMQQWYKRGRVAQEVTGNCLLQAVAFYKSLEESIRNDL